MKVPHNDGHVGEIDDAAEELHVTPPGTASLALAQAIVAES